MKELKEPIKYLCWKFFAKIVNSQMPLIVFTKKLHHTKYAFQLIIQILFTVRLSADFKGEKKFINSLEFA